MAVTHCLKTSVRRILPAMCQEARSQNHITILQLIECHSASLQATFVTV